MVSTNQKPAQRSRFFYGEVPEGLSGSTKSVACVERNVVELARPVRSCGGQVGSVFDNLKVSQRRAKMTNEI